MKLFTGLVNLLMPKTDKLSLQEKEDIVLTIAIEKGRKSGHVPEDKVMKMLHKIQLKKLSS